MSDYIATRIEKPPFFSIGPIRRGFGKRTPYVIGFDSESENSLPFMLQFSLPNTDEADTVLIDVPPAPHAAFEAFMRFVAKTCTNAHYDYLIYGWNLNYEWTQLFHDASDDFKSLAEITQPVEVTHEDGHVSEWVWHVLNDKRVFATIKNVKRHMTIRLLDGMMFYPTGLDRAAKVLGIGEKKHDIDRSNIARAMGNDPRFIAYAKRDAFITRLIGEHIVLLHRQYDISQTISAPHFASKVFRRRFLHNTITQPQQELEQIGLWSYHGGKNGYYLNGPAHFETIWQYDITSAYPEAMAQLPNIETAEWRRITDYRPGIHGLYQCTLQYQPCLYRGCLSNTGQWPDAGLIDVCVTSYELDQMLQRGEVKVFQLFGWEMVGEPGGPLLDYVNEFFALKRNSVGAERETAKLFLNSLYGKFFQKQALKEVGFLDIETGEIITQNPGDDYDWRAGGLYHPPIASLITGYVRAKIHGLEHKYNAIMTSTDGFFAHNPPDTNDMGKHLGGLTGSAGKLNIWRERLYSFIPDVSCICGCSAKCGTCGKPEHTSDCPAHPKFALHGWWSCLHELEAVPLARGVYPYHSRHAIGLRESTRKFKTQDHPDGAIYAPGTFVMVARSLNLEDENFDVANP